MNITNVSALNFRSNYQSNDPMMNPRAYRRLPDTDKLDVLYHMLRDIRRTQKSSEEILMENQQKMYNANKCSFQILADNSIIDERKIKLIGDKFSSGLSSVINPEEVF